MADAVASTEYWNSVANEKTFTHPFRAELFSRWVPRSAAVLDVGCGYGRVTAALSDDGWAKVTGVDRASAMVERGRREHPGLDLRAIDTGVLPFETGSFDAVLLFSVLTCLPRDAELEALVTEVHRVLTGDGVVYVSDLLLQTDSRNEQRYADGESAFGTYGVFQHAEGVTFRHLRRERLDQLFEAFETLHYEDLPLVTMNSNSAMGFQLLARRTG